MAKLKRTNQCAKCPWKVGTNPNEIPHGYSLEKHRNLTNTIADPADPLSTVGKPILRVMACHHSMSEEPEYCVGWLANQLGEGNNVALRMKMREVDNIGELQLDGAQHKCFEDTLPSGCQRTV